MAACPLLGDGITDDTLLHIGRFLPAARDLLSLQLSCPRFAAKVIAAAPSVGSAAGGAEAAAAPEMLCIAEEAARLWVARCSELERGSVPRLKHQSWLCLMQEVELLRVPLLFGRAHAIFKLSEGGAVATKNVGDSTMRTAASKVVMRSGRHFVRFTVIQGDNMSFGVIRPGWDVDAGGDAYMYGGLLDAFSVEGHCFYCTYDGRRDPGFSDWEGMQAAREQGDRIGMLLHLDQAKQHDCLEERRAAGCDAGKGAER